MFTYPDNPNLQHTLKKSCFIEGKGLHTGVFVRITLRPAPVDFGWQFKRTDMEGEPIISANINFVTNTVRATTLQKNGVVIRTIEHLLAAFVGMGVDNCLIEINAPELPILDGSAAPFAELIAQSGLQVQEAEKIWYTVPEKIEITDEKTQAEIIVLPANDYKVTVLTDFSSEILGTQYAVLDTISDFYENIAPARTFCFLHEIEYLYEQNLIKGGDIDNALVIIDKPISEVTKKKLSALFQKDIVINDKGYLNNTPLRFINEIARHKLLDLMGDLALAGYPLKAHIIAKKPGHTINKILTKKIKETLKTHVLKKNIPVYNPSVPPLYTIHDIANILPHRYPFLYVDKIISMTKDTIVGIKNVTFNEHFFMGHFPNNPIMPGVLQIEALAQTGGILALSFYSDPYNYDTYFLKINNCKFRQKIIPGEIIILKMELLQPISRGIISMKGTIYVGDKLCTEADLVAQIVKARND